MRASCSAPKAVRLLRKSDRREARPKVESVALVDEERQLCSAKKATCVWSFIPALRVPPLSSQLAGATPRPTALRLS